MIGEAEGVWIPDSLASLGFRNDIQFLWQSRQNPYPFSAPALSFPTMPAGKK